MTAPILFHIEQNLAEPNYGIRFLAERIQANKPNLLSSVSVIVPNGQARADLALALAHNSPQIGLNYLTLKDLANKLALSFLIGEEVGIPANDLILQAVVNSINASNPSALENFYSNSELLPNTEIALIEGFKQLDWLMDKQASQKQIPKSVGDLYPLMKSELNKHGYITEPDLYQLCTQNLQNNIEQLKYELEQIGAVILYLPSPLHKKEMEFLNELSNHAKVEIITNSALTEGVEENFKNLLNFANLNLKEENATQTTITENKEILYHKFFDPIVEVKSVVGEVFEKLAEGCAPSQLAILFTTPQPYRHLLHNELLIANIPFVGPTLKNLTQSIAGQALLALLEIAQNGFTTSEIIKLLEHNPKLAGKYEWKSQLRRASIPDQADNWAKQLERYGNLLDIINPVFDELQKLNGDKERDTGWKESSTILIKLLESNLDLEIAPAHQKEALNQINIVLQNLARIDDFSPSSNIETLHKILSHSLSSQVFWRKNRAGRGVMVGNISTASHIMVEHIWVVGLAEGFFPSNTSREKIISNSDWHNLAQGEANFLQNTSEFKIANSLKNLNAAKLAGQKSVRLSYPISDIVEASELNGEPTRWLEEQIKIFKEAPLIPVTPQAINLNNLSASSKSGIKFDIKSDIYTNALEMLEARQQDDFTRFDGLVKNFSFSNATSPTDLENYVRCPQAYFFKNVLRLRMDQYEESYGLPKSAIIGSIYHKILEKHNNNVGELDDIAIEICEERFYKKWGDFNYFQKEFALNTIDNLSKLTDYMNQREGSWKNMYNEKKLELELELPSGTYEFGMKVDLIEGMPTDSNFIYQALDYKTGNTKNYKKLTTTRKGSSEEGSSEEDERKPSEGFAGGQYLQYFIYAAALQDEYPDAEIRSGYIFVNGEAFDDINNGTNPIILPFEKDSPDYKSMKSILQKIIKNLESGIFPQGIYESIKIDRKTGAEEANGVHLCKWCDPYNTSFTKRLDNKSQLQLLKKVHGGSKLTEYLFPY